MGISPISNNFHSLNTIQNDILKKSKELSSGKRSATADPSSKAQADRLDASSRGLSQALRGIQQSRGVLEFAEAGISGINDSLARVKELTLQYKQANDQDKELIKEQIDAELASIDQAASAQDADGNQLLNGPQQVQIQVGENVEDVISTTGNDLSANGLGLSGFDPGSAEALQDLEDASREVSLTAGRLAATERRLDSVENTLSNRIVATEEARSRIEDVDYAQALSEQTKNQILQRQSIAVIAQANANAGALLSLFR